MTLTQFKQAIFAELTDLEWNANYIISQPYSVAHIEQIFSEFSMRTTMDISAYWITQELIALHHHHQHQNWKGSLL